MNWKDPKIVYAAAAIILALIGFLSALNGKLKTSEKQLVEVKAQLDAAKHESKVEYRTKVIERPVVLSNGSVAVERELSREAVTTDTHETLRSNTATTTANEKKLSVPVEPRFIAGLGTKLWNRGEAQALLGMNFGNVSIALTHPVSDRLEPGVIALARF